VNLSPQVGQGMVRSGFTGMVAAFYCFGLAGSNSSRRLRALDMRSQRSLDALGVAAQVIVIGSDGFLEFHQGGFKLAGGHWFSPFVVWV
jgi:hypothetical protein